jgi:hypothetical protein
LTLAAKQRLVVAVLAVLAAWPLAHRALVQRYDLDPWRFFGWAMYCTPKLPADVYLFAIENGARIPVSFDELTPAQRRSVYALRARRVLWGTFASPSRAGAAVLAARPKADVAEVVVSKWYLDPTTATIATHDERYRFTRPGAPIP